MAFCISVSLCIKVFEPTGVPISIEPTVVYLKSVPMILSRQRKLGAVEDLENLA